MINHLIGQCATVAAAIAGVVDGQRAIAFPGDAYAVVETFDLERFTGQQKTFAIARNHFVQGDHVAVTVDVHQITLEALAALMERDDQRVMAVLQLTQIAGDFQGRSEHLGWLRSIFRV